MSRSLVVLVAVLLALMAVSLRPQDNKSRGSLTRYVLPSWGNGAPAIVIWLPAGYERETKKPADFDLHYLNNKKLQLPGILVYVGHHPNPFSSGIAPDKKTTIKVRIAGREAEWIEWVSEGHYLGEVLLSGLYPDDPNWGGLVVHISINAKTEKDLHEAERWFAEISLQ